MFQVCILTLLGNNLYIISIYLSIMPIVNEPEYEEVTSIQCKCSEKKRNRQCHEHGG